MRFLLATEPELRRNLQVEVVIDVARGHDVRCWVHWSTLHKMLHDFMPNSAIFLDVVFHLVQIQEQVLLEVRVLMFTSFVSEVGICFEGTTSLRLR